MVPLFSGFFILGVYHTLKLYISNFIIKIDNITHECKNQHVDPLYKVLLQWNRYFLHNSALFKEKHFLRKHYFLICFSCFSGYTSIIISLRIFKKYDISNKIIILRLIIRYIQKDRTASRCTNLYIK